MKKIGFGFLSVLIIMLGVNMAQAQDSISAEKTALIKELFEATGGKQNAKDIMSNMIAAQREQSKGMIDKLTADFKTSTPAENAKIAKIVDESMERIMTRTQEFLETKFDFDQLVADVAPVYDKHFTADELRDIIAFYRSPTGQKAMKEMPLMMGEMVGALSKNFLPSFMDFLKQTTDEEMAGLMKKLPKKKSSRRS